MPNPYIPLIGEAYPNVNCQAAGDTYEDIVWNSGDALPSKATLDALLLDYKRAIVWEKIKDYRDQRLERGGYPTSVGWFHSDAPSRDNYTDADRPVIRAMIQSLQNNNTPKKWKIMSGAFIDFTIAVLDELLFSKLNQKDQSFYAAEVLKVGLYMSTDPDNYNYFQNLEKTKWPIIYGE